MRPLLTQRSGVYGVAVLMGLLLLSIPFSHLFNPIFYDEGVYVGISRSVGESGAPIRKDIPTDYLFITSPPLVYAVNGWVQRLVGDDIIRIRLVHILFFTLPTFFLIFFVAWQTGGWMAGLMAWLVLFAHGKYLYESHALLLNIPLGGMSLLALYVAHRNQESPRRIWQVALFVAMGLVVATKFQGLSVALAVGLFAWDRCYWSKKDRLDQWKVPLLCTVGGMALSLLVIGLFYYGIDPDTVAQKFLGQVARASGEDSTWLSWLKRVRWTALQCIDTLHGSIIAIVAISVLRRLSLSPLPRLLLWFFASTLLFNFVTMYLPGGGNYYTYPAIPALCVFVGIVFSKAFASAQERTTAWFILFMVLVRLVSDTAPIPWPGHKDATLPLGLRTYIQAHSLEESGVLASSPSIPALVNRRPALFQFLSDADFLAYLEGSLPDLVDFLYFVPGDRDAIAQRPQGAAILSSIEQNFSPVEGTWPGQLLKRRASSQPLRTK